MSTEPDALDALTPRELHDLAVHHAARHLDVRFFWHLLRALPAAQAAAGHLDEANSDVQTMRGHLDDITASGEGETAELLAPLYLEYLREHKVSPG